MTGIKRAKFAGLMLMAGIFTISTAWANGMGTPVEPRPEQPAPTVMVPAGCNTIVTQEDAALIQEQLAKAIAGISISDPNAPQYLSSEMLAMVALYGSATPACPCSDNLIAFVVAAATQQAQVFGWPDASITRAAVLLETPAAERFNYPKMCVAGAIVAGTNLASESREGTGSTGLDGTDFPEPQGMSQKLDRPLASK